MNASSEGHPSADARGPEVRADTGEILRRRYERLLAAYPPWWRTEYGAVALDTLLDLARDGQRWPSPREVVSLLAGAARARVTGAAAIDPRQGWASGLHLGAVLVAMTGLAVVAGRSADLAIYGLPTLVALVAIGVVHGPQSAWSGTLDSTPGALALALGVAAWLVTRARPRRAGQAQPS